MNRLTKLTKLIVDEASLVRNGSNPEAEVLIRKADGDHQGSNTAQEFWDNVIVPAVDAFSNAKGEQHDTRRQAGFPDARNNQPAARSREQLIAEYLSTPAGQAQYETYVGLPNILAPSPPSDDRPLAASARTLKSLGWDALDAIAKAHYPEMEEAQGHSRAARDVESYGDIYSALNDCSGISDIPLTGARNISKSKRDAVQLWKQEIERLKKSAGV